MSSVEAPGPFRRDGRERFVTEARSDESATRALHRRAVIELPAYLAILSLGPAALAYFDGSYYLLTLTVLLLLLTRHVHNQFRAAHSRHAESGGHTRRTWLTQEGIFVDGLAGPGKWEWNAVVNVRRADPFVVVEFVTGDALVLACAGGEAERLVAFAGERVASRVIAHRGRLLLLLAVLYLMCIAATVVFLG